MNQEDWERLTLVQQEAFNRLLSLMGKESMKLLVETAFATANVIADHLQVGLALTHLTGKARAWAFTCLDSVMDVFPTWEVLKQKLMDIDAMPDLVFQNQLAFLRCRQGTKDLETYIQELKTLLEGMHAKAYSYDVSIPVFMGGLR
ncbi:hypothetical protein PsorP6_002374 [Peronosclerospora sorghi]|uniref:Uncharacterized protein n=1 Tax=Peronosclerospora sorghi TaxID=230839 RepID=A0ACC0WVX5_9STRA|nr:hypothetical protein PsorP6_002374 [Peronosclerospora sorghi]